MQQWIDTFVQSRRIDRMRGSPQLTLGQIIDRLESMPMTYESRGKTEPKFVWFAFGQTQPSDVMSWRGSYAELAISFVYDRHSLTSGMPAATLLQKLRDAVGATFTGYKGGDYVMESGTPVWVANYGDSGNTGIVGVRDMDYEIVIDTAWCEF